MIPFSKLIRQSSLSAWYGNGHFEDWPRRTASDNLLHHEAFDIARTPKYESYQRGLWVVKLFSGLQIF